LDAFVAAATMMAPQAYHGSVSGSFKNALDWLILLAERTPPYLSNKPVGLVCTAGGVQGLQAVNSMDFIARALRGWSVPLVLPVAQSARSFDPDGHLVDEGVAGQLRKLGGEVCAPPASSRRRAPATTPTTGNSRRCPRRPAPGRQTSPLTRPAAESQPITCAGARALGKRSHDRGTSGRPRRADRPVQSHATAFPPDSGRRADRRLGARYPPSFPSLTVM